MARHTRGAYRKAGYYRLPDGSEVIGLKRRPDGRFYSAEQPGKTFGTDPTRALVRFHAWQGGLIPAGIERLTEDRYQIDLNKVKAAELPGFVERYQRNQIAAALADWIEQDFDGAAAMLRGLGFAASSRPEPSPTLESLGTLYVEKSRIRTAHEKSVSTLFWNQFREVVGVGTLGELTQEHITRYYDYIIGEHDSGKSQTWVKHRFGKVKSVLAFARKRGVAMDEITRVLGYCALLVPPEPNAPNPQPISADDFHKILSVANEKDTAVLLMALNCAMYAEEISYTRGEWVDLETGTFSGYRFKKGRIPRTACLWRRTVDALRKLPNGSELLFRSSGGGKWAARQIQRRFDALRIKAGVNGVEFRQIRDAAYTTAFGVDPEAARILAGHKIGMADHYVLRTPDLTRKVCEAIERQYFPTEK